MKPFLKKEESLMNGLRFYNFIHLMSLQHEELRRNFMILEWATGFNEQQ
jgi:hypothetical protein